MYALIEYPAGVMVEAVVLAMDPKRARIAAAGFPDTLALRRSGPHWLTETGQKVTFEFLLSIAPEVETVTLPAPALAARAAGSCAI
jgi:hypothetical protein